MDDDLELMMMKTIFLVVAVIVLAPTLQRVFASTPAAQAYAAQAYLGLTDYHELRADGELRWVTLHNPWITATFFNAGPDTAYIAINNPDNPTKLLKGESSFYDYSFAQRRIEIIFYKTDPGGQALIRVEGKY